MKYKAIIFDLGGVLLPIDFQRCYSYFQQLGIEELDRQFNQAVQSGFLQQFELGLISTEEFLNGIKRLTHQNISDEQIIDAWNKMILDFPEQHYQLLSELKNTYQIFLLSNTNVIHYQYYTEQFFSRFGHRFEELFTKTYFSFRCHLRKPDKAFFQLVLAENVLLPEVVIFFDDDIHNIAAARRLGIHAVHIHSENPLVQAVCRNIAHVLNT